MKQEIDLESIILEAYSCKDVHELQKDCGVSVQLIKEIMIEACNQTLNLAAENASITIVTKIDGDHLIVNKNSVLQIKGWIK